jgi:uncharacterized protein with NRDE domain
MCTLALYFRMIKDFPLLVAANRDEHYDRPSAAPHLWSVKPSILAGKDLLAGGTWLGVNEHGLLVAILNRRANGEPDPILKSHARSRGLLCLDILSFKSAATACAFINRHEEIYQPFTVVFVDSTEAWIAHNSRQKIETYKLDHGLHVYSSAADFAVRSEKVDRAHLRLRGIVEGLPPNCSDKAAWVRALHTALGDHTPGSGSADPREAICVHGDVSGTVSSTIIFYSQPEQRFYTFNCPGPPCRESFGESLGLNVQR